MHIAASDFRIDLSLNFLSLGRVRRHRTGTGLVPGPDPEPAHRDSPGVPRTMHRGMSGRPHGQRSMASPGISAASPAMPKVASVVTVFRCESQGRVTYADRPCEHGGVRVLRLPGRMLRQPQDAHAAVLAGPVGISDAAL